MLNPISTDSPMIGTEITSLALPTADVHESLISSSEKMHLTGLWILSLFKSDILSTASIIVLVLITTSVFVSFGIADLYSMNVPSIRREIIL